MLSENDRMKFAAALPELVEFAQLQGSLLTKQDVELFFEDISLTREHFEQIYAYLAANGIQVSGSAPSKETMHKYAHRYDKRENLSVDEGAQNKKKNASSLYLQIYLKELKGIEKLTAAEELDLYARLLRGDCWARDRLAEGKLYRVLEIVKEYADDGMVTEDLIQEGNIGLMAALAGLLGAGEQESCSVMIDDYIRQYVAFAADEQIGRNDQQQKLLAKVNLLHEASKVLAEEMGRLATVQELAEYTHLSIDEIGDIVTISEGSIQIGSGDIL